MEFLYSEIMILIQKFMLPFCRVGGVMMAAPVFNSQLISMRFRILLAICITIPIMNSVQHTQVIEILSIHGILSMATQVVIGLLFAFVFQIIFQLFVLGAQLVAMQSGLGFAAMVDPQSGLSVPLVSQLYLMITTLLFLAFNGHLQLIHVLSQSFSVFPLTQVGLPSVNLWELVMWGQQMFIGAVLMALPAVVTLLLINISFGMLTRSAPQLNIFSIGFPIALTIGIFVVYLLLANIGIQVEEKLIMGFELIEHWMDRG